MKLTSFLVALNYQTECVEMLINHAKFRINGNTGYVLKPDFLRCQENGDPPIFDIKHKSTWPKRLQKPMYYTIEVLNST